MKKVLIIDDEKEFCLIVKRNLDMMGDYAVETTCDGPSGIAAVSRFKPDIVLLDIIMPNMSGFDVLRELKGKPDTASIPVVMLTAVVSANEKEKALRLSCADYVVKPVFISELDLKIKNVLERKD